MRYLRSVGYSIVGTNVRVGRGEIDIVAEEGGELVFVEVRTRRGRSMGTPEESITAEKQRRMLEAGYEYLRETGQEGRDWRIDVAAVELDIRNGVERLSVIRSAVG